MPNRAHLGHARFDKNETPILVHAIKCVLNLSVFPVRTDIQRSCATKMRLADFQNIVMLSLRRLQRQIDPQLQRVAGVAH